jgi:uncharacterized protein involved in exopolysaccharide biosynthesis
LVNLRSQFNPSHPQVIAKQEEMTAAESALLRHGQSLLGRPVERSTLQKLSLKSSDTSGPERANLLENLISLSTQKQGLQQQSQELERQILQLESKLKTLSQQNATLVGLQRDMQIAEAVFSSTLTRLDLSKANVSAAYPPISLTSQPSLPEQPSGLSDQLILLSALIGSLFLTLGIFSLWWRDRQRPSSHPTLSTQPLLFSPKRIQGQP